VMAVLDMTIVNVALETLGRDLHVGLGTVQWLSTGYLLAPAAVIPLPPAGRRVRRDGAHRRGAPARAGLRAAFAWATGLAALAIVPTLALLRVQRQRAGRTRL
jgi:MFS family permease